jgi:alkanesulfonate monooxygenase SsuD/methylene tetrahydromethanopterin reductase-like flavin-dependent oxidoreductase (luciferase family)
VALKQLTTLDFHSRLRQYVDAGADGFVVNLDHQEPGFEERVRRFAEEAAPLVR